MPSKAKRPAEDLNDDGNRTTKISRTAKNADSKKTLEKAPLSKGDFLQKALPLHLNITHTPPSIAKEGDIDVNGDEEKVTEADSFATAAIKDIGFIGNMTLVPSAFSTGSYGWKGSRRMTVELQQGELNTDGKRETVQVMLSFNATVIGSKPSKPAKGKSGKKVSDEEEAAEEADIEEAENIV